MAKSRWPLRPVGTSYPFETVAMDTAFVTLPSGRTEYFIVAVDYFTKWVEVQSVKRDTAHAAASMLRHSIIFRHGCPEKLLTDNGPSFKSKVFQAECAKWGIRRHTSATYHAATNGLAERTIGTLKRSAEKLANGDLTKWAEYLGQAVMAYRMTPHVATGFSPFRLLYGREATTSQELGFSSIAEYDTYSQAVEEHTELVHRAFQEAYKTSQRSRERRAARWNQRAGVRTYDYPGGRPSLV